MHQINGGPSQEPKTAQKVAKMADSKSNETTEAQNEKMSVYENAFNKIKEASLRER